LNRRTQKALALDAAWILGTLGALGGLAWRSMDGLEQSRAGVRRIEQRIEQSQAQIDEQRARLAQAPTDDAPGARLLAWSAMADSQSDRVGALSRAAQRSGVQLAQMRSFEPRPTEDAPALECSHEITVTGSYFQLGRFLAAIQSAPGLVGVEDLLVAKQAEPQADGLDLTLRASMWVRWYAADPAAELSAEGGR
jgi:hypothetical protein